MSGKRYPEEFKIEASLPRESRMLNAPEIVFSSLLPTVDTGLPAGTLRMYPAPH
jgi:hypothetical protein